jgi:shikimate kinase
MMPDIDKVYIIGFMGSGKTTTGLKLASLLGWEFTDLDKNIEENTGMTIPEIFSHHGEAYFREVESGILRSVEPVKNRVISTGGGTPCFCDNMNFMLNTGLTLYLKLTAGQLKSRLSDSNGERPLIKDLNDEELLSFITEKLAFREKWYEQAELTVNGFDTDIRTVYSQICSMLKT